MEKLHPWDPADDRAAALDRFTEGSIIAVVVQAEDGGVDVHMTVPPSAYLVDVLACALQVVQESLAEQTELQKRPS